LRELLAKDGSIYVHLDENMAFYIKVIMDEVFSSKNFKNWITRKKCNPKNYTRKTYGDVSDYIIFYTNSDEYVWNRSIEKWTEERAKKEYTYTEEETGRKYKKVPLHAPGIRNGETGKPWKGLMPPPGKHWQYIPKTLDEMDARGEITWSSNGNPRRKIYLDNTEGVPVQDIWLDFKDAHNQNIKITGYPTEKNPDLIKRIIEASSNPGDVVLDCFAGSGTTMDVAGQLGRNWIGIDNSPEAIATTLRRFHKGTEAMGDFVNERKGMKPKGNISRSGEWEIVSDFILYSVESHSDDLTDILNQWKSWQ
jgi:adenine-specific DNA-methyltransferase